MNTSILKKLGFSDKIAKIYLNLLSLGPSSVRKLAEKTEINRGTVYDGLIWLQDQKLVGFYLENKKQYFVAENPEKLSDLLKRKNSDLEEAEKNLNSFIPELKSLHDKGGDRPVSKYFDKSQIHKILEDVLETCEKEGELVYRIYSVAGIREYLYDGFETFSDVRVSKGIKVKAIAMGEGGELRGLDERKWINEKIDTPTYILIYPGKTAYISLNAKDELVGVVIENEGVYKTQEIIFDNLWKTI